MHYIDLLNYMIDVQKIEKNELAELLAIPVKRIDNVLSGITPLKKRCLKNLSLYTGFPLDAISSGSFILNNPQIAVTEGEEQPQIVKDAYVPEHIREVNTKRLNDYCKKRYKNRGNDVLGLLIVQILFSVIGVIASMFLMYTFKIVGLASSIKVFTIGIIPALLGLIIGVNCYKYAWRGTVKSEKHFVFYTILHIIQILSYTIALVVSKWAAPLSIIFAILAFLPVIYTVFFEKSNKLNYIKSLILGFISAFFIGAIFILVASSEYLNSIEDDRTFAIAGILSLIGFFIISISSSSLIISFTFNRKRNNLAKYFEPFNKKNVFNGNRILKNILVVFLLTSIISSVMYVLPVIGLRNDLAYVLNREEGLTKRYLDYDKQNIIFTENEKYTLIENDIYSIKVPDKLLMSSDTEISTIYKNNDNTLSIIRDKEYIDVEELIDNAHQDVEIPIDLNLKQEINKRYGFFPKTLYENDKLMKMIYNDNINIFDRHLNIAVYYFIFTDAVLMNDSEIYLFENGEIAFRIQKRSIDRKDGKTAYIYDVSGNTIGNYDKFFDFTILTVCDNEEEDIAYKIINSIEFK